MLPRFLYNIVPFLCSFSFLVVLTTSGAASVAMADATVGMPDQTILSTTLQHNNAGLQTLERGYISAVTEAGHPFTHILLNWDVVTPTPDTLTIEVRVSDDGQTWTDWGAVLEDHDLWMPEDGETIHWGHVIYAGTGMRFWQVRATFPTIPDATNAELDTIKVHTVDGRYANDNRNEEANNAIMLTNQPINKPSVISRTAWGSPDGQGSRVRPAHYPVNHMVIHHTVDANTLGSNEQNWGDRVRAIWSFHTFSRGWGDIGYNYLVAPDGTIYEGRSGGDDAVGFHDAANYGSMGVSMIGTYDKGLPTVSAQTSLVNLLAWKAYQKDIDPLGRSFYYGCSVSQACPAPNAITDNIAGHRQIRAGTACPGESLHTFLPSIRNRVSELLSTGGTPPDNGDLSIDELESSFSRSNANWYEAPCGYGGHTFYTYATNNTGESTNKATWRPTIPADGAYRIYAHIPQGCGLKPPPYATTKAHYTITYTGGVQTKQVDHNTNEEWVYLGTYSFSRGTTGFVELTDLTGEPYSQGNIIFFDSIKWEPESQANANVELLKVSYESKNVPIGSLLKVTFTVRNNGTVAVNGQAPQTGMRPDGSFDPHNGYVYDEGECFLGATGQNYPTYPKQTNRFRVMLGPTNRTINCAGDHGGYPWRWGINGTLHPGETRDIIGYVRFRIPGAINLQTGAIQEYVKYHTTTKEVTEITISPEVFSPIITTYDKTLQPLAMVYKLSSIPDNFLARTQNPLSIDRGEYIGNFAWDGNVIDWGDQGPLGQNDTFLIEQTRTFRAPVTGTYMFRTLSDDGSWLWINGKALITNYGLHEVREMTGTVELQAGVHILAFKYFERTGRATAGYAVQHPGATTFTPLLDGLGDNAPRLGEIFTASPEIILAADDLGGSGVTKLRYSWDGILWQETPINNIAPVINLGKLVDGVYHLRYQAFDKANNSSNVQSLAFRVDSTFHPQRIYVPILLR